MKNILIINGHERFSYNEGRLNMTLTLKMQEILSSQYTVKLSILQNGWNIKEEQEKFLWANTVIFQMPVYWFSTPALLKRYMEEVYEYGVFYKGGSEYGSGGLLNGKKYMLSTTWNSPLNVFGNKKSFFEGKIVDDILVPIHKTQQFIGMEPLPSFSCHDVVKNPDINFFTENLKSHLKQVFHL